MFPIASTVSQELRKGSRRGTRLRSADVHAINWGRLEAMNHPTPGGQSGGYGRESLQQCDDMSNVSKWKVVLDTFTL